MKRILSICLLIANIACAQSVQQKPNIASLELPNIKWQAPSFNNNHSNDFLKKDLNLNSVNQDESMKKYFVADVFNLRSKFLRNTQMDLCMIWFMII